MTKREGRYVRGVDQVAAVLTPDDVLRMRNAAAEGATGRELVAQFGVSKTVVSRVITGRGWAHVGGPIRAPRSYKRKQ
ncbi:endonuclease [Arthrobacter phage Brent]|uniref:Helix-turn-helix DNA binding domain protein n=2 Tax=Marthavirus brent TaxID=1980948 RepID=A0A222Z2A1_9CAUD|nr:endonuclease [Arthrobacter phage Brent]ALF01245.1 helix-turn-helix DNA binding domain protein [Arthrobacter phage Brent]ASR78174.1 helix-turn-helix DNA binding domain protein [Arthrobacter phage Franzy]